MARREPGPFGVMEPGSVAGVPRHWLARRHLGSVSGMRLTTVGCSGSMPGPHSPASCYLLEADGPGTAVELASRIPAARMGGAVEVRPVLER